jgi:hypothetical protein
MNRPRMTTRRLIVVVAIVGSVLGAEACRRRLASASARQHAKATMCRAIAETHKLSAELAMANRKLSEAFPEMANPTADMDDKMIARCRRLSAYYRDLEAKYDRAARYPWLPVAPDPPEPEDKP